MMTVTGQWSVGARSLTDKMTYLAQLPAPSTQHPTDQTDQGATTTSKTPADQPAIQRRAADLFDRIGFQGDRTGRDAKLIWQVAALVERGKLPEGTAVDAAGGPPNRTGGPPDNPVAYFRQCLDRAIKADGDTLANMLKGARLPKDYATDPAPPPDASVDDLISATAAATEVGT